jgi:hypothetical protein
MIPPISSNPRLPAHARVALELLSFSPRQDGAAAELPRCDWRSMLQFCDRTQLTLPVGLRGRTRLPPSILDRTERNLVQNTGRWERIKQVHLRLSAAFESAGLEFLVLKGFSHCPLFIENPRSRVQYDLDLLLPHEHLRKAYEVTRELGYEPLRGFEEFPLDHLPAMVKKTGWEWKGDYFDVELPLSIELHFRLWDLKTESFNVPGLDLFWDRRQLRSLEGLRFAALDPLDTIGYATLHLTRHLFRGDVRLFHVYELACLLNDTSDDTGFWEAWRSRHHESLQRVSLISFALAHRWFGCAIPTPVSEAMRELPAEVRRWLQIHGDSPVTGLFYPNKDELWLHWNLISSPRRRMAMMGRRLIPDRPTGPVDPVHLTKEQLTWCVRARARWRYFLFLVQRIAHHLRALPGTIRNAVRWFSRQTPADAAASD